MGDDADKGSGEGSGLPPEKRLEEVLAAKWDPGKLSKFMKGSQTSKGQRLEAQDRGRFEKRLGVDLGAVRIYTGTLAEEITKAHGAEALTVGDTNMILMRESSKFQKGSAQYTSLLAHELTHVAQARPDAMARKSTSANQADKGASEQEAEQHEAEVLAELTGQPGAKPDEGSKSDAKKDKKDQLMALVVKLIDETEWLAPLRSGSSTK
jgi:hypothetical protein